MKGDAPAGIQVWANKQVGRAGRQTGEQGGETDRQERQIGRWRERGIWPTFTVYSPGYAVIHAVRCLGRGPSFFSHPFTFCGFFVLLKSWWRETRLGFLLRRHNLRKLGLSPGQVCVALRSPGRTPAGVPPSQGRTHKPLYSHRPPPLAPAPVAESFF